jgi:hypothetical protein
VRQRAALSDRALEPGNRRRGTASRGLEPPETADARLAGIRGALAGQNDEKAGAEAGRETAGDRTP